MRESWFGRRSVGCVSSVAFASLCAALALATPASAADLFTEPAPPQAYGGYPPPPPAYGPPPYVQQGYVQQGYVQQSYVPAPAPYVPAAEPYYRPYAPSYRPYGWAERAYSPGYVEAAPRPPAPIAAPAYRPWGPYGQYEADVAEVAPPAYGYPPRW